MWRGVVYVVITPRTGMVYSRFCDVFSWILCWSSAAVLDYAVRVALWLLTLCLLLVNSKE